MKNLQLFSLLLVFIFLVPGNGFCEERSKLTVGKVITIHSKVLQENRKIIIRLPGDYENSGDSYSVLYLLDAQWEDMLKTKLTGKRHLFFIYGKDDFPKVTQYVPAFKKFIESNHIENLNFAVKIIPDDGHVPYASLFYGLRFIFSKK